MVIPHGTDEWYAARRGLITASRASCVVSRNKGSLSQAAKKYAAELAVERVTGSITQHAVTYDMQRGIDLEPEARRAYEADTGEVVDPGGLIVKEVARCLFVGASPDGLLPERNALLEIKCPRPENHAMFAVNGIPMEYLWQMQVQMLVSGADACHFYSYSPPLRPLLIETKVDKEMCSDFVEMAMELEGEIRSVVAKLQHTSRRGFKTVLDGYVA